MTRHLRLFSIFVIALTALLAFGWWAAAGAERRAREAELRAGLRRTAGGVRAAIDESLEELRAREDRRPFYHYHHYFSPPDVLAVSDPVAVTPLATNPEDPRLVGHFQIDPDGNVRTPYDRERAPRSVRTDRVLGRLAHPAFGTLKALIASGLGMNLLSSLPPSTDAFRAETAEEPAPRPARIRRGMAQAAEEVVARNIEVAQPEQGEQAALEAETPDGPLAVGLEQWSNTVVAEIEAAQRGSLVANQRLQARGRQMPRTRRNDVAWTETESEGTTQRPTMATEMAPVAEMAVSMAAVSTGSMSTRPPTRRVRRPRAIATAPPNLPSPLDPSLLQCDAPDEFGCAPAPQALLSQREADVGYTPMRWRMVDGTLVLHRLVSHDGASVVQGALVDHAHLRDAWIPGLVERYGEAPVGLQTVTPELVPRDEQADCAVRAPSSELLHLDLCYTNAQLAPALAGLEREGQLHIGVLLGVLLLLSLVGVLVVRAAKRVDELSRQKSAFVSAVSHELRTPLTTLRMHAEMLDEGMVVEGRREKVYGELVQESVRLGQLIENVLELSRLEEGAHTLRLQDADLRAHLTSLVESQRAFLERRDFQVDPVEEGGPLLARFDAQALDLIVLNLLDNASKYGAGEERRITVSVSRAGSMARLVVRDRGAGVPAAERSKIFERFHRVVRKGEDHLPGTGIGLALVLELTEAQGGTVTVGAPELGPGCEVRVELPLA